MTHPTDHQPPLDVFIAGELVDLCVPSDDDETLRRWASWFNNQETTQYLHQGLFPQTVRAQRGFLEAGSDRIITLIRPKKEGGFIGVASLSAIDPFQRNAYFAMVIGEKSVSADSLFYGLEAKALLTGHAFEKLGLERVNSGQVTDLIKWQRWQILFGFQIEGVQRNFFRKGLRVSDNLVSSCLLADYLAVKRLRGGRYWPGKEKLFELMRALPERTLMDELRDWLPAAQAAYWEKVFGPPPPDESAP